MRREPLRRPSLNSPFEKTPFDATMEGERGWRDVPEEAAGGYPLPAGIRVGGVRGKWKSRVICVLAEKERLRYSELRRELTDVTDAALAATLKALIADGILWRQQFDEIPPRVEYFLTEKGASVVPILRSICQWAGIYRTEDPAHALPQCKKCNYRGEAPGGTGWAGA